MKIVLKEDIYMAKQNLVFPKDVTITTVVYNHKTYMIHPTKEGVLGDLPKPNKYIIKDKPLPKK